MAIEITDVAGTAHRSVNLVFSVHAARLLMRDDILSSHVFQCWPDAGVHGPETIYAGHDW